MSWMKSNKIFYRLWNQISTARRKQMGFVLLIMLLASFFEVLSLGAVLPFLGALISPEKVLTYPMLQPIASKLGLTEPSQILLPLTALFCVGALVSGAMRLMLLWFQTRLGFAIGTDLSIQIYKRTLYQNYSVHVARNSSEVITAISSKTDTVINNTLLPLFYIISSSIILCATLTALLVINPIVALVVLGGFGGIYGLILITTKKTLIRNSQRISRESNQVIKALQEGLGGIRDVLIDGTQSVYCQIYQQADLKMRRSQASINIIGGAPRFLIESLGMVLIAVLSYYLVSREEGVSTAIPVLGALALGAQRILPVLQLLYASWSSVRGNQSSLRDILDLLEQPLPNFDNNTPTQFLSFRDSIQLNQVTFQYNKEGPYVLRDINFKIRKGSRVGFIGATGSGKSTLLDIIMGLLYPSAGNLVIDGNPITEKNYRAWQKHIAHVPQAIFLADATVAENIAFGVLPENIDYERVKSAACQAQIATAIESWKDQYMTLVGERGIRLSGGQRQRIGIARALYKRADVIIFDEATSALDNDTEREVMDAINCISDDITILIVAHRLTTLKNCDVVFELYRGELICAGTYSEMISRP